MSIIEFFICNNILPFVLIVMLAIAAVYFSKYSKKRDDEVAAQNMELAANIRENTGVLMDIRKELSDLRVDFNVHFNSELAKKLDIIMQAGEKPTNFIKKYNSKTGKDELVPIDPGW